MMKMLFVLLLGIVVQEGSSVKGPLTDDFQSWLESNNYTHYDFVRHDYGTQGSYGGFADNVTTQITHTPVIFFHGNSDSALKTTSIATGWDNSIAYFTSQGYSSAELYATSFQDNNPLKASTRVHDCEDLVRLRAFVEAIMKYTNASTISIVSHSMGVTLARKVIQGGLVNDTATNATCDLGGYLGDSVDVFVGIAGANYGLCSCTGGFSAYSATCSKKNGFWPGDSCGAIKTQSHCGYSTLQCNGASTYSSFLADLNAYPNKIAQNVFSMWSKADDLINNQDLVWTRNTSLIPMSDDEVVYTKYTHMQSKELTAEDQYKLVTNKTL